MTRRFRLRLRFAIASPSISLLRAPLCAAAICHRFEVALRLRRYSRSPPSDFFLGAWRFGMVRSRGRKSQSPETI